MRKFVRNQKGFTLIELMMVVAVIGILAAVLIPKIGGTKDSAKLAGVDANARIVQAQVESLLQRNLNYPDKFKTALESATPTSDVINPFDSTKAARTIVKVGVPGTVVGGQILVEVTPDIITGTGPITAVKITPYDNSTTPVAMPSITVNP